MPSHPTSTPEVRETVTETDLGELTRGWARVSLLSSIRTEQRDLDAGEARKLKLVTDWADLHRTDAIESFAGDSLLTGHESFSEPILMSGVPVEDYCLAELATTLRTSHGAARSLTEQGLEARERLPRLWAKNQTGVLPTWKLRLVARETLSLSDEAADYVDRHLAPFARDLSPTRIKNLITTAITRFDPDRAAADEAAAAEHRGVWFDLEHGGDTLVTDASRPNGTGRMEAVADTPDLLALKDALEQKVHEQRILGAEDSDQVLMAKGLGILADPQYALDITATTDLVLEEEDEEADSAPRRRPNRRRPTFGGDRPIHIHLHTSSETARLQSSGLPHAASPISRVAVERWIHELAPGVRVKVTPVIDLNSNHAVDHYEAPDHIRALVDLRDDTCVFPFCTNRGRYDLDHTAEYVELDDGGPPGQTSNRNLAKLCRYHHRAKTHTTWTYKRVESVHDLDPAGPDPWAPDWLREQQRDPDTGGPPAAYLWTSPIGFTYLVTATGTYPRD